MNANGGWHSDELHSILDNYPSNTTEVPQASSYCSTFKSLRGDMKRYVDNNSVAEDSANAWGRFSLRTQCTWNHAKIRA